VAVRNGRTSSKPDNRLLDIFAINRHLVNLAKAAILGCADIIGVRIPPATFGVAQESLTIGAVAFGTASNLPARNEGVDVLDSLNAQFLFCDGLPNALQAIEIGLRVQSMIGAGFVRCDEPLPFIMAEGLNGHAQHSGDGSDGV
jgi:hypothetical protein